MEPKARWTLLTAWAGLLLILVSLLALGPALSYPMRLLTAGLAVPLLRGAGFAVEREDTVLHWGASRYDVSEECSGVRKLWAALVLAWILSALYGLGAWRTTLLLAAAAGLAAFSNVLRIAALFHQEIVLGWESKIQHDATGLGAFALVVACSLALANWLATPARSPTPPTPSATP